MENNGKNFSGNNATGKRKKYKCEPAIRWLGNHEYVLGAR